MKYYSLDDVKELYEALNNDKLKQELYKHMFEDFDEGKLQSPYCGSLRIHKNGKHLKDFRDISVSVKDHLS